MKIQKLFALALALILTLALFTACGKKDEAKNQETKPDAAVDTQAQNDTEAPEETEAPAETDAPADPAAVAGETVEYIGYSVLVPEGWELKEPGEFSSYDFSVRKSDFYYFDFNTEAENENAMQHYNYNKDTYTNEQVDVEATYGENTWTGFQYSDGWGGYGFEAYTSFGEKIVRVSSAGFTFDSPEAQAILASLTKN